MFATQRHTTRQSFFDIWASHRKGLPLDAQGRRLLGVMLEHPEYHAVLNDPDRNRDRDWSPEGGAMNPFLHMGLHVALVEQKAIDQPPGIRETLALVESRLRDAHEAEHRVLECLAETLWRALHDGKDPDMTAYLACVRRAAGLE